MSAGAPVTTHALKRRRVALVGAAGVLLGSAAIASATVPARTVALGAGTAASRVFAGRVGPAIAADATRGCAAPACHSVALHLAGTPSATGAGTLAVHTTWSVPAADVATYAVDPQGVVHGPGLGAAPGAADLVVTDAAAGTWRVLVAMTGPAGIAVPASGVPVDVTARLQPASRSAPADRAAGRGLSFTDLSPPQTYQHADDLGRMNAGEPSVGVDWKTGAIMYMAGAQVSRVTVAQGRHRTVAHWTDVTPPQQGQANEDAILFTDPVTGRTFAEGLLLAGSDGSSTDDDGATWTQNQGFPEPHGPDHETIGAGPYAAPKPPTAGAAGYPHAVYYCSQNIVSGLGAFCGRSDTGSMTFNPSSPVFGFASGCGSIHGHVKVGPDGTVYLPQNRCKRADLATGQGMAVSRDNGATWTYSVVPDGLATTNGSGGDPSVGVDAHNRVYFAYVDVSGALKVAASTDHGAHWARSRNVGSAYHVRNSMFPAVVAGDNGRAAVAFLGTASAGDDQKAEFRGTWYLYVAFTYDGGRHWTTTNVTPGHPVQRGCIWNGGGDNACRNLLDFNDAQVDKMGRVVVAYTDGCANTSMTYSSVLGGPQHYIHGPSRCESNPHAFADTDKVMFIGLARQDCGPALFARYAARLRC